ncbi:MAG: ComF family protein [Flavobacteriaceae bacterium]
MAQDLIYTKLSNILNDVNSVMFPRLCFGCNARLYRGEQILCTFCRNQLPLTEYSFNEENAVDRIFYGRTDIKKASSFMFYYENGVVQNLIHHLKYKNQSQIGEFIGDWYGSILSNNGELEDIDCIIPVPLHRKKLKSRGYNQVSLFAEKLAKHLDAEYLPDVLLKTANTKTQTRKRRISRGHQNSELYVLKNTSVLSNRKLLLVDDVITTGGTIEACANALLNSPNVQISVSSMAVVL